MSESTPTPQAVTTPAPEAPQAQPSNVVEHDPSKPLTAEEMFELKVNGKQLKMTKSEVIRRAQLAEASQERYDEAAKLSKEAKKIIENAKTNPIQALMDPALGLTKQQIQKAFEEWYHAEVIESEALSDDEKELREYRKEKAAREQAEKEAKERAEHEAKESKIKELTVKQQEIIQNQLIQAMDEAGLPKTAAIASRMAFFMRQAIEQGWDDVPPQMIAEQVRKETQGMTRSLGSTATAEQLIDLFGDDVINKIRKYDLEQLRSKRRIDKNEPSKSSQLTESDKKVSYDEVDKKLRQLRFGK